MFFYVRGQLQREHCLRFGCFSCRVCRRGGLLRGCPQKNAAVSFSDCTVAGEYVCGAEGKYCIYI